jgi:hypothetical protein
MNTFTDLDKTKLSYFNLDDLKAGAFGSSGPPGPVGPAGSIGPAGPAGPIGPAGFNGVDGTNGVDGPPGPTGFGGATGLVGPQGVQGLTGSTGPAGLVGPQGVQGLTGSTGPAGLVGPQGVQGLTGSTGPVGPQGAAFTPAFFELEGSGGNQVLSNGVDFLGQQWFIQKANVGAAFAWNSLNTRDVVCLVAGVYGVQFTFYLNNDGVGAKRIGLRKNGVTLQLWHQDSAGGIVGTKNLMTYVVLNVGDSLTLVDESGVGLVYFGSLHTYFQIVRLG